VSRPLADWRRASISLAHEHSLRAGVPTIAVLGTGILDEYPKGSAIMRERIIADGGTIVTEYLPHISYSAKNFVQRNRLQAALGQVLIPVEWSRRSGTAHTVRFASALERPIACRRGRREVEGPAWMLGEPLANLWMRMDQMPARDRAAAIHLQIISSSSRRRHRRSSPWPASARPW
jgi:hypothetical protein